MGGYEENDGVFLLEVLLVIIIVVEECGGLLVVEVVFEVHVNYIKLTILVSLYI